MAASRIATLPVASRSIIRSATILTSLPQLVAELVQNSLDAGATHVDVGVNVEQWECWVRDDGSGIDRSGMDILVKGSEEGRYGTSKAYDPPSLGNISTFGFRGEALASAGDVSCLEICSRTSISRETWSVILKGGKKLYYGPAVRWRRERPGTTVCVRDAFYNLPIRRLSHPNVARTLELIRKDLGSAALVFPGVAFSLENSAKEKAEGSGKGRILTIPKATSSLAVFRHLFGRALCEHVDEIDVKLGHIHIQGFFSLEGSHSKALQFLYVNRHRLSPCDLHRVIDACFAASTFGKHALDEAGKTRSPRPGVRRSPRKNERHPIYVLNVTLPSHLIDNCLEPGKTAIHFENPEAVSSLLSSVVQSFLARSGFCKAKTTTRILEDTTPAYKKRRITNDGEAEIRRSHSSIHVQGITSGNQRTPVSPRRAGDISLTVDPTIDDIQEFQWAEPNTGQIYMVDSKTGNSYPLNADRIEHHSYGAGTTQRALVDTRWLRKTTDPFRTDDDEVPDWIEQALEGWKNPTFGLQEPDVPSVISLLSLSHELPPHCGPGQKHNVPHRFFDPNLISGRKSNAVDTSTTFDQEQLRCAEIIGQVDRKFVACVIQEGIESSKILVLVDQHAADERIRVERFLSALCKGFLEHDVCGAGVGIRVLRPAVPILLTRHEARALSTSEAYRHSFERWGIRFTEISVPSVMDQTEGEDEYVQVLVEAVPDLVSEKLLMGDELRELVKGFLSKLEAGGDIYMEAPTNSPSWFTALRWCPRELLELVNSKACRGAIMFNDLLDMGQCKRLISQLSDTVWPFMCAHGRPSLVPLTNVENKGRARNVDWNNFVLRE